MINVHKINNNIYITSDEPIKIDDWYLTFTNKEVMGQPRKCEDANWDFSGCKKIILTTDFDLIKDGVQAIHDEFLEWFVKNPSCESIEVQIMNKGYNKPEDIPYQECYRIIIPQEEPKLNLPLLEAKLDDALSKETKASLTDWLKEKREQEEPKKIKCYCGHTTYCDCEPLETSDEAKQRAANYMSLKGVLEPKKETIEETSPKVSNNHSNGEQ